MTLGLRAIVLAIAAVLFLIAVFISEQNWDEVIALGLAAFALAFLIDALGLDRRFGVSATSGTTTGPGGTTGGPAA